MKKSIMKNDKYGFVAVEAPRLHTYKIQGVIGATYSPFMRVQALKDFADVKKGDLGGIVSMKDDGIIPIGLEDDSWLDPLSVVGIGGCV